MNIYQRIILIAGAIAFVVVLLTAPRYIEYQGSKIRYRHISKQEIDKTVAEDDNHASLRAYAIMQGSQPSIDLPTAIVRGLAVLGTTVLLYFAAGGKKRKEGKNEP